MKTLTVFRLIPCLAVILVGCGDSKQVPSEVKDSPLKEGFQNASPEIRKQITQADKAIKGDRYAEAFKILQEVGTKPEITTEQTEVIFKTVTKMKKVMDYHPKIGTKEAYSAMRDLIGALDPEFQKTRQEPAPGN